MYFRRVLEKPLGSARSKGKIRLLFGARQAGKTSLLKACAGKDAFLVNLATPSVRRAYEADPGRLSRELMPLPAARRVVVLDEIQKVPALLDEVQALYDSTPKRFELFLTGSSARKLRRSSGNLLPGRAHIYHLAPVCSWEVDGYEAAHELVPRLASGTPKFPRRALGDVLLFGCLPGIIAEAHDTAEATLASYVEAYLEEEIRREAAVRDLGAFSSFVRLAALASGGSVNVAAMSQDSGVPASTIKSYYQILVDTFAGRWVTPYLRNDRQRLLKTPRFYFFDNGVRNAAAGLPLQPGLLSTEGPRLLEHWVGLELLARADYLGRSYRVSFWRTRGGAEVNFVFEGPHQDIPIEVKWTEHPTVSDARHIERFIARYPERARQGLLVCRIERPQQLTPRVLAVPAFGL